MDWVEWVVLVTYFLWWFLMMLFMEVASRYRDKAKKLEKELELLLPKLNNFS